MRALEFNIIFFAEYYKSNREGNCLEIQMTKKKKKKKESDTPSRIKNPTFQCIDQLNLRTFTRNCNFKCAATISRTYFTSQRRMYILTICRLATKHKDIPFSISKRKPVALLGVTWIIASIFFNSRRHVTYTLVSRLVCKLLFGIYPDLTTLPEDSALFVQLVLAHALTFLTSSRGSKETQLKALSNMFSHGGYEAAADDEAIFSVSTNDRNHCQKRNRKIEIERERKRERRRETTGVRERERHSCTHMYVTCVRVTTCRREH